MTTDQPRASATPTVSLALACEGDEAGAYKGRVLDGDTLRAHAADIARIHGAPRLLLRTGPLPGLFAQTRATIEAAYAILGAETHRVDSVSAEEWLLDNRYVIEEQIREIDDDLPRGYLRKLPRVTHGAYARYPPMRAAVAEAAEANAKWEAMRQKYPPGAMSQKDLVEYLKHNGEIRERSGIYSCLVTGLGSTLSHSMEALSQKLSQPQVSSQGTWCGSPVVWGGNEVLMGGELKALLVTMVTHPTKSREDPSA